MKAETSILHPERSRRVGGSLIPIVVYLPKACPRRGWGWFCPG